MLTRAFLLKTDFAAEILGSLVRFYNIKLEYYIFPSSDALIVPAAFHPSMPCLIFDRHIPQSHVTLTPKPQVLHFFVGFIMVSK